MFLFSFFHKFFRALDSERWAIHINDVCFEGKRVPSREELKLYGQVFMAMLHKS